MQLRTFIIILTITFAFSQDPEALLRQGETQLESGYLESAESSFNSALNVDPSFAPALQALSKLFLHKGDLKKANEFSIQGYRVLLTGFFERGYAARDFSNFDAQSQHLLVRHDIDIIFLYRRPLLDYWVETGERLEEVVRHVLIHEIGHHFGLSDADMERIEEAG